MQMHLDIHSISIFQLPASSRGQVVLSFPFVHQEMDAYKVSFRVSEPSTFGRLQVLLSLQAVKNYLKL